MDKLLPIVIFDLDDTLYKECDYVRSGCRAVVNELSSRYNISPRLLSESLANSASVAAGFDSIISLVNKELSVTKKSNQCSSLQTETVSISDLLDIYRNHTPELQLPDETGSLLEYLSSLGIKMGIITDGRSIAQRGKIRALGLEKYFSPENIIISDEVGADKTKPDGFRKIMNNFLENIDQNTQVKFIYVADNPRKDFFWPNRLGWTTVQLLDPKGINIKGPIEVDQAHKAQIQINHLTDLISLHLLHNHDYVK